MKRVTNEQKTENSIRYYGKLFVSAILTFCISGVLMAQQTEYESEDFKGQWFIGLGVGPRMYFADHARQLTFADRISGGADVYVGRWWNPIVGTRLGASWQVLRGATKYSSSQRVSHAIDRNLYIGTPHYLYRQQFSAYQLYADLVFNVSNLFEGSYEDRFWTLAPFVGIGYISTFDHPDAHELALNIGLLNKLRVGENVDLVFDMRGAAFKDRFKNPVYDSQADRSEERNRLNNDTGGRPYDGIFSFNVGVQFRFGSNSNSSYTYYPDPVRPVPPPAKEMVVEKVVEWKDVATDVLILFRINESVLLRDARVQIGFLAKLLHQYPEGTYTITGYADEGTGNPDLNMRLSRARAERVKECLVNEFGISPSRLQTVAAGGIENRYYNDPSLSRSVIVRPNKY